MTTTSINTLNARDIHNNTKAMQELAKSQRELTAAQRNNTNVELYDEKGQTPAGARKAAEEKISAPKERLLKEIESKQMRADSFKDLKTTSSELDTALKAFKDKTGLDRVVDLTEGLKGTMTVKVDNGAPVGTKSVEVLQVAKKQKMIISGLTTGGAKSNFTSGSVVSALPTDGQFENGTFTIQQNGNLATVALNVGDTLQQVATSIRNACAVAMGGPVLVTPTVEEVRAGQFVLVLESNDSGTENSFLVNPTTADIFDNIERVTPHDSTKVIRLFADSDKTAFDPANPSSPPASTLPVTDKFLAINNVGIGIRYDSAPKDEQTFADMIKTINDNSRYTGVIASLGGASGARHIILERSDGRTGISVSLRNSTGTQSFGSPENVFCEGEATDAEIMIDGKTYSSPSNNFFGIDDFSEINVKKKGKGDVAITKSSAGLESRTRELIEKYNSLRGMVAEELARFKSDEGTNSNIYNSQSMSDLAKHLNTIRDHKYLNARYIKDWSHFGVTFNDNDKMATINEETFTTAFADPELASERFGFFCAIKHAKNTIPAGGPASGVIAEYVSQYQEAAGNYIDRGGKLEVRTGNSLLTQFYSVEVKFLSPGSTLINDYEVKVKDASGNDILIPAPSNPIFVTAGANGTHILDIDFVGGGQLRYTTPSTVGLNDVETVYASYVEALSVDPEKKGSMYITNFGKNAFNINHVRDVVAYRDMGGNFEANFIYNNQAMVLDATNSTITPGVGNTSATYEVTASGHVLEGLKFTLNTNNGVLNNGQSVIFKSPSLTHGIASLDIKTYLDVLDTSVEDAVKSYEDKNERNAEKVTKLNAQVTEAEKRAYLSRVEVAMIKAQRASDILTISANQS